MFLDLSIGWKSDEDGVVAGKALVLTATRIDRQACDFCCRAGKKIDGRVPLGGGGGQNVFSNAVRSQGKPGAYDREKLRRYAPGAAT